MADGTIRIATKLDTADTKKDLVALEKMIDRTAANIQKASAQLMGDPSSGIDKAEAAARQMEPVLASVREQIEKVADTMVRLGETRIETSQFTELNGEIEATRGKLEAVNERMRRFMETGGKENSTTFRRMEYDANSLEDTLRTLLAQKEQLEQSGGAYTFGADTGAYANLMAQISDIEAKTQSLNASYAGLTGMISDVRGEIESADDAQKDLTKDSEKYGRTATSSFKEAADSAETIKNSLERAAKKVARFSLAMLGVRGIYSVLRKAASAYMADNDTLTNRIASAWSALGNTLGPIITYICNLFISVIGYVNAFVSALTGISITAKSNTSALENQAGATSAAGGAASKAEKQLASFDEQNKLTDTSGGGGGGGGGGALELPNVDNIFSGLNEKLKDFATSLGLTIKDVFLDWSDLTGEQILEKIVVGLGMIAGGIIGFALGGPGGAAIGVIVGAGLSLIASALIFDHDGEISKNEVLSSLVSVLGAIAGGAIGFVVGGPGGAAIGASIGFGISLIASALVMGNDGINKTQMLNQLIMVLSSIAGGVIGFVIGGPAGAAVGVAIGAVVGIGIKLIASSIGTGAKGISKSEILDAIVSVLTVIAGGLIGFTVGGPFGAAVGVAIGLGINFVIENASAKSGSGKSGWDWFITDVLGLPTDDEWNQYFNSAIEGIKEFAESSIKQLKDDWFGAGSWFEQHVTTPINKLFGGTKKSITTDAGVAATNTKTKWAGVGAWFSNNVTTPVKKKFEQWKTDLPTESSTAAEKVEGAWDKVGSWFETNVTTPVKKNFEKWKKDLPSEAEQSYNKVKSSWSPAGAWFGTNVGESVKSKLSDAFSKVKGYGEASWSEIKNTFAPASTWFKSTFTSAYQAVKNVFSTWTLFFSGLWETIKNSFSSLGSNIASAVGSSLRSGINSILSIVQNSVNSAINLINGAIRIINKVPGVRIGSVKTVHLPRLARGGIVNNPGRGVPLVAGESGREAILPLDNNTEWMDILAEKLSGNTSAQQIVIPIYLSGKQISKYIVDLQARQAFATNGA